MGSSRFCCHLIFYFYLQQSWCATLGDVDDVYTRYDRDAYIAARHGRVGAASKVIGKKDSPLVKEKIRGVNSSNKKNQHSYDDLNKCTTYLAPSSIPNSGMGMYTTTPYQKGDPFPYPEIGIILQEKRIHSPSSLHNLLAQYPWAGTVLTWGAHEVGYGEAIVPGLGMLANSHLGLVNMRNSEWWKIQPWRDGSDSSFRSNSLTKDDVGRGAHSWHGNVMFQANVPIKAGEELFVSYGDAWFTARQELLGIVPGDSHFKEADEVLQTSFLKDPHKMAGGDNAHYEKLLNDTHKKDKRLRAAMPNNLQDVPAALASGTARFSAKESIRSVEWLEENGACIDNIVSGVSTIAQAGKGAFATRSINKGERITTTPVITLTREELNLWEIFKETGFVEGGPVMELIGHQLFLNYCWGHTSSSLLFFPYAPSVNFINHGSVEESNAEIRWSKVPYHKVEWMNATLGEMKERLKPGLLFDIVATRDLRRGDEVLIYYGKDWEESWNQHIKDWASMESVHVHGDQPNLNLTDRLGLPTTLDLNQVNQNPIVKTNYEQVADPYPPYIMTRCRYKPRENCGSGTQSTDYHCQARWELTYDALQLHPCTILSRDTLEGRDWYTAKVEVPSTKEEVSSKRETEISLHLVQYMPRSAIIFVDSPYSRDQYAYGVFRQNVGLPDGILPPQWMDLEGGGEKRSDDS
ncbi:hypothetical protein ACHAXR_010407 [Thalassiosira sp. AJA248-18]